MKIVKIENNWGALLIEKEDLFTVIRRNKGGLEESLRGYKISEILIPPGFVWDTFQGSEINLELDRLIRMGMRVYPETKYSKLEESPFLDVVKAAMRNKETRRIVI